MKGIIQISKVKTQYGQFGTPVTTDVATVYAKLISGDYAERVNKIALNATLSAIDRGDRLGTIDGVDALPYLLFSATFGRGSVDEVRTRTHLVLLSVNCPEGLTHIAQLKERAAQLPYTLLAFSGSSQKTLKIVVRCQYGDGQQPQTVEDYGQFLSEAHQTASRLYEALAGCRVTPSAPTVLSGCRMSNDPEAYFNPEAQTVTVVREQEHKSHDVTLTKEGDVEHRFAQKENERMKMEFYACLDKAFESATDAEEVVQALAYYCHKAQLPEEMCVNNTMLHWSNIDVSDDMKRRIFRTVYKKQFAAGKPVSQMNEKERIARFIKDFFDRRYQLRYNEVKQQEEFRLNNGMDLAWQPLTQRDLKRIAFEEMMEGGYGWSVDIETYVQSTLVKSYNPIMEFLMAAESHYNAKRDYIGELARRVPTDYEDWERFFHRWFLAMVAQWMGRNRDFGNAMVPMLIGKQGTHKTTFCKQLLPRALREYYMDDIKMENAEQVERVLGRMALVNIDEYNAKTEREQAKIKRLLTERDVQVRRMRSDQYTLTKRLCSFIATTNDPQPLSGGDGTRRYLCVELTGTIDTETPIDYPRLYAQAIHEIREGQPYRFFPDEEALIQEHNRSYQQHTSAEDVLLTYFAPAEKKTTHFMKAVDIQKVLSQHLRTDDVPSIKLLTVTLKRCGFSNGAIAGQRGWYAKPNEK